MRRLSSVWSSFMWCRTAATTSSEKMGTPNGTRLLLQVPLQNTAVRANASAAD